jgi:hypothetical protein
VKVIADKQQEVTTEHLDLTLDLSIQASGFQGSDATTAALLKNFKANVTVGGDLDTAKNNFSLTGSADIGPLTSLLAQGADKLTFDLVKVDDKMYSRTGTQDWSTSDVSASTSGASSSTSITATQAMAQLAEIIKNAAKAEKLSDESIDGTNTYHYKVTLDAVSLIDQLVALAKTDASSAAPPQADIDQAKQLLKDSTIELDMWVGQQDLYVRQETVHINLNLTNIPDNPGATALVDFMLKVNISKLNQPVSITAPQ